GNKLIVGVHERNFDHDVQVLVNLGYKVSVAEQTETAKLKKRRVKNQKEMGEKASGGRIIQRQIAQVMSKGTFIDYNNPNYEPRYLLALRTRRTEVAIILLELGYGIITVGYFNDNESFLKLETLLTQIRPTE
ncbi:MutS N-terminal domain-containing protein, partial [Bifidobacterium longum]|uniref:hypothetical protein n=1 Tax=Bifidobacterium longum TaxID=216816 RepID=UPI001BCCB887